MVVLKFNFNTVFINIYNNVFMSKTFWSIIFGGQIFSPSSVNRHVCSTFFWKAIHNLLQLFTYKNISRRANWLNKLSYKNKLFLVFIIFWTRQFDAQFSSLTRSCKLETWSIHGARKKVGSVARTEINPAGFNWSTQNGWLTTLIPDTHS